MVKKIVLVGMSGGVDSSVAAAMMHQQGYEVIGVTLQLSQAEKKIRSCCGEKDIQDAHDVALQMGFTHYTLDYATRFKTEVIDNFLDEYSSGFTPNPCVKCNQHIKFGDLIELARELGADYVATGHYVREQDGRLFRPKDLAKDQTYFLAMIAGANVGMIKFPLGDYYKHEIREMAERMNLPVAKKPESQDLCFVQNGNYREMLREMAARANKGLFVGVDDEILGYHEGFQNYTIGQRKGIQVNNGPWFVIKIIAQENKVVLGRREDLLRDRFEVSDMNLFSNALPDRIFAQVRAQHTPVECTISSSTISGNTISLKEPAFAISPGQCCAFYSSDGELLGGARILS